MKEFIGLTRRNLLVFFKDILAVFFSLLTSIIVFVLYLLFLKGTFVDAMTDTMKGLENIVNSNDIEMFANGILLSGVLGSAIITVPYTCLQTIVKDRENGVDSDICSTPLKRWKIILSYFTASSVSAFLLTSLILTIGLIVLNIMGDVYMPASSVAASYGIVLLGSLSSTSLFMVVMLLMRSSSTSTAFFGILAAASGFVIGAYIPLSRFSDSVMSVCNLFPASHITSMLRNVLLSGVTESINSDINGLDNGAFVTAIKEVFSFNAKSFGTTFTGAGSTLYILVIALVCIVLMTLAYNKTYKRR
ncbi:MAG: ABC transporter permease [Clostridiales bacterium]|nr:ABC transporter permease [Clostridiales bacterium]